MSDWIELFTGRDLAGWKSRAAHEWQVAGSVSLRQDDDALFSIEPGDGMLVNGPTGRTVDLYTAADHGSCELYLDFCVSRGSNSGVYLMGQYEIQILDSWGTPEDELTFSANGGIYARWVAETRTAYDGHAPLKNASRPPGEWQSFEVVFHAPRFSPAGERLSGARFERVIHNGVLIHENVECTGPTRGAWSSDDTPLGPLRLQGDHGPVACRNIRMRPLP